MYKDEVGPYQARKASTNRSELIAHVDDLISGLLYLDENGTEFTFAACNLKRIPKWEPNETDFVSIAEKMVLLEGRLKSLEFVVSENKVEINKNKNTIGRVEKRVEQNEHCIISGIQHGSPNFPTRKYSEAEGNNQSKQSAPESVILPPLVQRPLVQRRNGISFIGKAVSREGVSRKEQKPPGAANIICSVPRDRISALADDVGSLKSIGSATEDKSQDDPDRQPFVLQREQQRRQSRRQRTIIRGTASTDTFRTAPLPVRDFFLYRIDKDVTEKQIKDYLKDKNVQCLAVQKMSSEFAKFSSFKVTVPVTEVGNIMDADTWPEGAMIRKFTVRQQNQDNGGAGF